jgi:DNA-binding protein YbaB
MERPEWGALSAMFEDVKRSYAGIGDAQRKLLTVTGTAWSEDRMVKAVVGPRGHLLELEIDPRVYRRPDSAALAASIVATVRVAVQDVTRQTAAIVEGSLPRDLGIGEIGGMGLSTLLRSHDADVLRKGDDSG